jgi:hypothetical protein
MSRRTTTASPDESDEAASGVGVNLPLTPADQPDWAGGRALEEAEQRGRGDVATDAIDAPGLRAGEQPMLFDTESRLRARHRGLVARQRAANSAAAGHALVAAAQRGQRTRAPGDGPRTQTGATEERNSAKAELVRTENAHDTTAAVLDGERPAPDGAMRPGTPIAADPERIDRAVLWERVRDVLPLAIPLVIETIVVSANMRELFHVDDGNWWLPASIAVIAVISLTLIPYRVGRSLNVAAHGGRRPAWVWAITAVASAFWIGVGVTLAIVRVQVDGRAAVREAEEQHRDDVLNAVSNGIDPDSIPPFDASAVYDPVLPSVMWIVVLLGVGVALVLFELWAHDPARLDELVARRAVLRARRWVALLTEQVADIAAQVELQRQVNTQGALMWQIEQERIAAEHEIALATYAAAAAQTAGTPEMIDALEDRLARTHTEIEALSDPADEPTTTHPVELRTARKGDDDADPDLALRA